MCGKTSTTNTTQSTQPPWQVMQQYQNVASQANQAAQTPYSPYTGEMVAPLNEAQYAGIGGLYNYANAAQPVIGAAENIYGQASQPLTQAQIQNYYNPYQQAVIGATEQQFNQQNAIQNQQVKGNAIAQGALGGDREAIAESVLAGQQQLQEAPVIAGLEQQGYNQALATAAQQYQQNPMAAAYGGINAALAGQTAGLQGATGLIQGGTLEQQTQQARDVAAQTAYWQQQGYPFQVAQWLAQTTLGFAGTQGSQTQGTTTQPAPFFGLSDERTKEDISRVGSTKDGQPLYRYRFKGDPEWHVGLIAQDVEKKHPEAVADLGSGYKGVDVKAATDSSVTSLGKGYQFGGSPMGVGGFGAAYGPFDQALTGSPSGLGRALAPNPAMGGQTLKAPPLPTPQKPQSAMDMFNQAKGMAQGAQDLYSGAKTVGGWGADAYQKMFPGPTASGADVSGSVGLGMGADPTAAAVADPTAEAAIAGGTEVAAANPLDLLAVFAQSGGRINYPGGLALPARNRINLPMRAGLGMPSFVQNRRGYDSGGIAGLLDNPSFNTIAAIGRPKDDQFNPLNDVGNPSLSPIAAVGRLKDDQLSPLGAIIRGRGGRTGYQGGGMPTLYDTMPVGDEGYAEAMRQRQLAQQELLSPTSMGTSATDSSFVPVDEQAANPATGTLGTPQVPVGYEVPAGQTASGAAPRGLGYAPEQAPPGGGVYAPSRTPPTGGYQRTMLPPSERPQLLSGQGLDIGGLHISPEVGMALLSGVAGLLASPSPFPGTAIGQGLLTGLQTYGGIKGREVDIEQRARQLDQAAQAESDRIQHETDVERFHETQMTPYEKATLAEKQQFRDVPVGYRKTQKGELEPIPGGPADPNTVGALSVAKMQGGLLSDAAVDLAVSQLRAGDKSALQNIGRGAQSAANLAKIRNRLAERAQEEGWTGSDIAAANANFTSQSAAARTMATREANIQSSIEEARQTFGLAEEASKALPRSDFVPWNRAVQAVQAGTSSPELARYVTALRGVITAYAQAMSRTGVTSVHSQQAAEGLLNQATGHEGVMATLDQMRKEMDAAAVAPEIVRQTIMDRIRGTGGKGGQEAPKTSERLPATATPTAGAPQEGDRKQFKQGMGVYHNGQWVPETR